MHFEGSGVKLTNRVYAMGRRKRGAQQNDEVIDKMVDVSKIDVLPQEDDITKCYQQHQQNHQGNQQSIKTNPLSNPTKNTKRHVRSGSAGDAPLRPPSSHLPSRCHNENINMDGWSESRWSGIPERQREKRLREQLLRQEQCQKDLLERIREQQLLLRQKAIHEDSVRRQFCLEIEKIDQLTSKILARRNY